MRRILFLFLFLAWSLWFGGEMTLFISVISLFHHDRSVAIQAAPQLFFAFERYQLILSVIALLSAASLYIATRYRLYLVILGLVWAAGIAALVSTTVVTPRIMELREQGLIQTPEFKTTHGRSMMVYTAEAVALLLAGLMLPTALQFSSSSTSPSLQTTQTSEMAKGLRV